MHPFIDIGDGIVPLMNVTVDCSSGYRQVVCLNCVIDMLSSAYCVRYGLLCLIEALFGKRYSFSGFCQESFVVLLRRFGFIDVPGIMAAASGSVLAAVTDEWCFHKLGTAVLTVDKRVAVDFDMTLYLF